MRNDISFAWRCWLVKTDSVPWEERTHRDQPEPPPDWYRHGFETPWIKWGSTRRLSERQVSAREPYSLAWCQRTQQYWVFRGDCAEDNEPDESEGQEENWTNLYCHHLRDHPGLWELIEVGATRQHDSICPLHFDEFLPKNFFTGTGTSPQPRCHFVGHLSLILALLAMCPRDVRNIPRQINEYFYRDNSPRFVPWWELTANRTATSPDLPMDRYKYPGRAIVMQTGLILNNPRSTEEGIVDWEKGRKGPMVSSDDPTEEEWQAWANTTSRFGH